MDEADRILLVRLRQAYAETTDDGTAPSTASAALDAATGLADVDAALLAHVTSTLIHRHLDAEQPVLDAQLPESMLARYRRASELAATVQRLAPDTTSSSGYELFMYAPGLRDMRRLLAWLLDAVPMQRGPRSHDADEDFDESMCSVLERLRKDMQRAARMATVMRWIPPAFVERGRVRFEEERVWWRASERWDRSLAWAPICDSVPLDKQFEDGVELAAALLHRNQMAVSREALCQPALDAGTVTKEWLDARRLKQERGELSVVSPASPSLSQPPTRTTAAEMTPTLSLHDQFEQRHSELSVVESELDALCTAHTDASGIFDALSTRYAREVKITELMRDPEANMAMLQADVDEVDGRRQALKERWLEFRRPAEAELAELMHRMELMESKRAELAALETENTRLSASIPRRKQRLAQLQADHARNTATTTPNNTAATAVPTKSEYASKAVELAEKIRQQDTDIERVRQSTADMRAERERSNEVLTMLYADITAKCTTTSAFHRQLAMLIKGMRATSQQLVETVEETGRVQSSARNLEETVARMEKEDRVGERHEHAKREWAEVMRARRERESSGSSVVT